MIRTEKIFIKAFSEYFPFFELVFIAAAVLSGAGIARFWGRGMPYSELVLILLLALLLHVFQSMMQYRTLTKRLNPFQQKTISGLVTPWGKPRMFSLKASQYTIDLNLYFLGFWITLIFILLLKNRTDIAETNLLFFLALATVLLNWLSVKDERHACYFELTMGFQTAFLPFMFTFSSAGSAVPFGYMVGFAFPVLLIYLAWRFVLSMAAYDKNVDFEPGIFPILIRKQKIWLHHVFMAGIFGLWVVANLSGVFWRLFVYQLVLVLPYAFQIMLLERMLAGAKPNWKLTGFLAYANVLLLLYFQNITFWFNSF